MGKKAVLSESGGQTNSEPFFYPSGLPRQAGEGLRAASDISDPQAGAVCSGQTPKSVGAHSGLI